MTNRSSIDNYLHQAEETIAYAEKQLTEAKKQEHYNEVEYSTAQLQLEQMAEELEALIRSANPQQKEQLYRMQLQVRQTQQHMILDGF